MLESDAVSFKIIGKTVDKNLPDIIFVKGGTFQMGSDESGDEKPIHSVTVSDFYIGKYEVTNAEFVKFLNAKGNKREGGRTWIYLEGNGEYDKCRIQKSDNQFIVQNGYDNYPVIFVSRYGAKAYCKWLSETTGQNYDLPTEAEWEYTAGGGGSKSNLQVFR